MVSMNRSIHLDKQLCSPPESVVPGLVTHFSKHLSVTVCTRPTADSSDRPCIREQQMKSQNVRFRHCSCSAIDTDIHDYGSNENVPCIISCWSSMRIFAMASSASATSTLPPLSLRGILRSQTAVDGEW
jgi:hypothetical protein